MRRDRHRNPSQHLLEPVVRDVTGDRESSVASVRLALQFLDQMTMARRWSSEGGESHVRGEFAEGTKRLGMALARIQETEHCKIAVCAADLGGAAIGGAIQPILFTHHRHVAEIAQARLLTLHAAHMMDTVGNKVARQEIAMIKVIAPSMALKVIDRAIQVHGGAGVSQDTFLAEAWAKVRTLRLADGPDEVHMDSIAKMELRQYR